VHSKPLPKIMNGLVMAPDIHVRQSPDGRLVAGSDYGGADPGADAAHAAAALFGILQGTIRAPAPIVFDRHTIGLRPIPVDGFPAIGPVPGAGGLYAAVTHSGVTLAPAIGLFLAQEVIENRRDPLLAPYGLERFCKQ
jgi:glycine/D-amino acid oxidase-like deaminating enzyme